VVSKGRYMTRMCAARERAIPRCNSSLLMHLSLSLSLFG
jgi:hypothetical protein